MAVVMHGMVSVWHGMVEYIVALHDRGMAW